MSNPRPKFSVGDTVRITSVRDCVFGWNQDMINQIGREAKIISVDWNPFAEEFEYSISGEAGTWAWDDTCFEEGYAEEELEEFDEHERQSLIELVIEAK